MTTQTTTTKTVKSKPLFRSFSFKREDINEEARTVEISFSSEEPVERWFGVEILDHSPASVRLGRLADGGAVLVGHNPDDHVGATNDVSIDADRKGRALVRFGRGERASEIFNDVIDRIRTKISVGYNIYRSVLEEINEAGQEVHRVIDWEPFEVSFVSIPADVTVGVGRSSEEIEHDFIIEYKKEGRQMPEENKPVTPAPSPAPAVDVDHERSVGVDQERKRTSDILALGDKYGQRDLATSMINKKASVDEMREALLERMGKANPVDVITPVHVDMSDKEEREYSLNRGLLANANGDWTGAGLEREVSVEIGKQLKRDSEGFYMPTALRTKQTMQRAPMLAGTDNVGGFTVADELQPLIEILRNKMAVKEMGANVMTGLEGDIPFPRQIGTNSMTWVGENPGADVGESNATFDSVKLSPKTAQSTTAYSRQLLAQSSTDMEMFTRNDLALVNALGLDLAALMGSGVGAEPTGIYNTTGIGDVAGGANGAAPTNSHIIQLETEVAVDNADLGALGYLTNSRIRGKLKETEKFAGTSGIPVWGEGDTPLNGYRAGATNQLPTDLTKGTSTDCSPIIFGNWNDLVIGEWGAIELLTDPYALKKQGLIEVTSIMLVDILVRRAQSFSVMKDARHLG